MHIHRFTRPERRSKSRFADFGSAGPPTLPDRKAEAAALALGIRVTGTQPVQAPRPHRGQLPDVDFARVVVVEKPSVCAQLIAILRRLTQERRRTRPAMEKADPAV